MSLAARRLTCLAVCVAGLAPSAPALAAGAAEELFNRGVEGMAAGRYDEACPLIERSNRLEPRPAWLFALAECESTRGRIATAVTRYDEYLAFHATLSGPAQQQQGYRATWARNQHAALVPHVPKLVVALAPGAPPGAVVTCDGAAVAPAALETPLSVDPGEHVLVARMPGGQPTEVRVKLGRDERRRVEMAVLPAPLRPPEAEAPPPSLATSRRRVAAYALGGAGLAALIAGSALGALALGQKGAVDAGCGVGGVRAACTPAGKAAADRLQAWGTGSTVGLSIGAGAAIAAVVLFATEPRPDPARTLAGARLAVTRDGATLDLTGTW
jgi:hypothetical protein